MMEKKKRREGFTLIELLIVMVILGLLAALVGPRMFGKVGSSKLKAAKAQISLLETALDTYRLDVGKYPTTDQGLEVLRTKPSDVEKWDGPYLPKDVPMDPWGKPYVYRSPGEH
ncbi:MAG: type II secretion system protein GspG, partial [Deltaproteobacteria bacterium CG_4_8_14_3_um_filter_51_11]